MPTWRLLLVGCVSAAAGAVLGSGITAFVQSSPRSNPSPVAAPAQSPSNFFRTFDPHPIVESISGQKFGGGKIRSDASSVSGGGLRWGERRFVALWESAGGEPEKVGAALEKQLDGALAAAGMSCPNPIAGSWLTHTSGAVFQLERRYQDAGHHGKLRGWLHLGESGRPSTLILTVDEEV